jgi:hypothetical protein
MIEQTPEMQTGVDRAGKTVEEDLTPRFAKGKAGDSQRITG